MKEPTETSNYTFCMEAIFTFWYKNFTCIKTGQPCKASFQKLMHSQEAFASIRFEFFHSKLFYEQLLSLPHNFHLEKMPPKPRTHKSNKKLILSERKPYLPIHDIFILTQKLAKLFKIVRIILDCCSYFKNLTMMQQQNSSTKLWKTTISKKKNTSSCIFQVFVNWPKVTIDRLQKILSCTLEIGWRSHLLWKKCHSLLPNLERLFLHQKETKGRVILQKNSHSDWK